MEHKDRNDTTRAPHKSKVARNPMPWCMGDAELSAKLTISGLHQYLRSREHRPLTRPNRFMPRFDLTFHFKLLAATSASFSVRTRIVVLALIPVGGLLANGFTYT